MAQDVLQQFLTARLFDVKGDEANVARLRATAGEVAGIIQAEPHRAAAFTMVAIDSRVSPNEPIVAEVIRVLERNWNSYASAFADGVIPVVARAIVLDALARVIGSDPLALAVTLTARNMLPHVGEVVDRHLWEGLLGDADRRLEARARRDWALPGSANAQVPRFAPPDQSKLTNTTVNREWLLKKWQAASGPHDAQSEAIKDANPNWTNSAPQWSYDFAPRASAAVADAVDAVAKKMMESINERDGAGALGAAIATYMGEAVTALSQTALGLERRTALLWWKEALYSPGARCSYRDLEPTIAAAWVAVDAAEITGPFAPRMAEAFVTETVRALNSAAEDQRVTFNEVVAASSGEGEAVSALRQQLAAASLQPGRTTLASLVAQSPAAQHASERMGLPSDLSLGLGELALWLYRDLQIARGTVTAGRGKRKPRA